MKKRNSMPCFRLIAVIATAAVSVVAHAGGIESVTRPSRDVTMSFTRPGQIGKVLVRQGDTVRVGDVLVHLDDTAERAQLAQSEAQAQDTTRIRAAKARLDQKKVLLKRKRQIADRGGVTKLEMEEAALDVTIAELSLELAKFQHAQDILKYEESKFQVERMKLKSPIPGKVENVFVETGESVNAQAQVVRVVNVDPMWIDVPVPIIQARRLTAGAPGRVRFGAGASDTAVGKIIHVAAVADAASDTLNVRVEVANPSNRPAGQRVFVEFPVRTSGKDNNAPTDGAEQE